ncbi:MAG TPA: BadF/BadG/BcrA/BcrD ATPase family protein [Elusimicrobiota bacterium]|nr:BadF/BadG/BcrA/BcrD ATPase family protein [Elusimicrobiota bacterium]
MRVVAVDAAWKTVRRHVAPAPPPAHLGPALQKLFRAWRTKPLKYLTVASKGIWEPAERRSFWKRLRFLAERVWVISDVELAFEGAFTPLRGRPGRSRGILLSAGTGSIAFGRDERGRAARAGGMGPRRGDEGSGYWMGREYLKRRCAARRGYRSGEVARVAAGAKEVLRRARRDQASRKIVREAHRHLARLAFRLAEKLHFGRRIPMSLAGGLFEDVRFRKGFWRTLKRTGRGKVFVCAPSRREPARAAAQWGPFLKGTIEKPFGYELPPRGD